MAKNEKKPDTKPEEASVQQEEEKSVEEKTQAPETNEWQDKYVRLFADFDNYKKRTQKEMLSSYSNGASGVIEELLPVIDNLERAVGAVSEDDDSNLAQGIQMVYKQLQETLTKLQVKPIPAVGEKFDPNLHNAVMHIEDEELEENVIVEEFLKGYQVKDKVIRHSMVKVAN